jgi:hypothetical protein
MPDLPLPFLALMIGGLACALVAIATVVLRPDGKGNPVLAAALAAGFSAFTAITIVTEGVTPVLVNHASNLWGVQVWWDLLFSLTIALFLIAPRARAAGMNILPWTLFIAATASIGLLAMCARLFWLEREAASKP